MRSAQLQTQASQVGEAVAHARENQAVRGLCAREVLAPQMWALGAAGELHVRGSPTLDEEGQAPSAQGVTVRDARVGMGTRPSLRTQSLLLEWAAHGAGVREVHPEMGEEVQIFQGVLGGLCEESLGACA